MSRWPQLYEISRVHWTQQAYFLPPPVTVTNFPHLTVPFMGRSSLWISSTQEYCVTSSCYCTSECATLDLVWLRQKQNKMLRSKQIPAYKKQRHGPLWASTTGHSFGDPSGCPDQHPCLSPAPLCTEDDIALTHEWCSAYQFLGTLNMLRHQPRHLHQVLEFIQDPLLPTPSYASSLHCFVSQTMWMPNLHRKTLMFYSGNQALTRAF